MGTEIIIHNSISLDGSLTGFMPEMGLHYKIAGDYKPDAHLIGSETILKGFELFGEDIPDEEPKDFEPSQRDPGLPWWIIVDSGGRLKGILHTCRRLEYCRDVIIFISETTPSDYMLYLKERKYKYFVAGKSKVEIKTAIDLLKKDFEINRILTDTGRILGNLLINQGLATEISLLVHPLFIGEKSYPMFTDVTGNHNLKLIKSEQFENGCIWLVYRIKV